MASKPGAASFEIDLPRLRSWFGIGVAGNFAGHLEQAGEAGDFVDVAADRGAPKGLFPFYAPGHDSFLSTFPLSHDEIALPVDDNAAASLQIEPEVALACSLSYTDDGRVAGIAPFAFGAFNDCSIRMPGAAKISEKKNWGACSKGVASDFIALEGLDLEAGTAGWRGTADDPLEPVGAYLGQCGRPHELLVAIGATRYTTLGEATRLRAGDESVVAVYDATAHDREYVVAVLEHATPQAELAQASVLVQAVVG